MNMNIDEHIARLQREAEEIEKTRIERLNRVQRLTEIRAEVINLTGANDDQPASETTASVYTIASNVDRPRGQPLYPNKLFLNALTTAEQSQTELHGKLKHYGVSVGTVHGRYTKLAADPTTGVVRGEKGWRLDTPAFTDRTTAKPRGKTVALARTPLWKAKATRMLAANDVVPVADIGIKIDAGYCADARQRIAAACHEPTPPPIPILGGAPTLIKGDGLAMMRGIPSGSIPLVLADLPYGTTHTCFDPVIDVQEWMEEMLRIVTPIGAVVAFAAQPFTTKLINAASPTKLKQTLVWQKTIPVGFQHARGRHLTEHEDIMVFSHGTIPRRSARAMTYNPQNTEEVSAVMQGTRHFAFHGKPVRGVRLGERYTKLKNCPRSVLRFAKDSSLHIYSKPVDLLQYLIRTFSNDGDLVLDPTMGSGSAGVAAFNTGRRFIGAENGVDLDGKCIFSVAERRIRETHIEEAA